MFLLLVSFSISFGAYFLREKLKQLNLAASQLQPSSHADGFLEAVNLDIHQWTWIPTFLKVYFIGVVETIYITLCQRGLFKSSSTRSMNESHVDTLALGSKNDGSIAVITGGDSGIGLEICRGLLDAGFHVIIGTHSVKSCEAVIDSLQKATSSDKISSIHLDLTNYQSVRDFVDQIQLKVPKKNIQLLINNAGIMNTDYKMTDDGFESQCQTNFLSPMLLTRLLLPYISPKSGRVLFASSSTLYTVNDLDLSVPSKKYGLNGLDHYAYSKSCIAQLVPRLAKTTPVKIYAYHPGTVRTKLFSTTTVFNLPLVSRIFHYIMLSPKEGCRTPLFLCLSKDVGDSGTYWANEHQQTLPSVSVNGKDNNNEALWIDTMQKINLKK
ncbi:uncharacterized protein EV154DRAFT_493500 [Mucor mucedo]|uniref:uncharacterized protein n=1 Tax=Mucor mucedo TaxID=29922 RepID=UPI00221FA5A5|nr:uncharacterized protein EV154DRAFT_493500 [Mucor mucedo]KAI7896104.1 hypothetical protein EV154DRAFT_493500 [Mucor mucedo]